MLKELYKLRIPWFALAPLQIRGGDIAQCFSSWLKLLNFGQDVLDDIIVPEF
jgi:hypothetical protein